MGRAIYAAYQEEFAVLCEEEGIALKAAAPKWEDIPPDHRRQWGRIARRVVEKANSEDNPRESRMKR